MNALTLGDLALAHAPLCALADVPTGDLSRARKLARLLRAVAPVVEDLEARRQVLLHRYARTTSGGELMLDAQGDAAYESAEDRVAFERDFGALLAQPVEVPERLTYADLEGCEVSGMMLYLLGGLLEDEEGP